MAYRYTQESRNEEPCAECQAPELWVLETPIGSYAAWDQSGPQAIRVTHRSCEAAAWGSEAHAIAARESHALHGFAVVKLPDADARKWGAA